VLRAFDLLEVMNLLHSRIKAAGSQVAFSRESDVERTHLKMVLNGRRPLSPRRLTFALFMRLTTRNCRSW